MVKHEQISLMRAIMERNERMVEDGAVDVSEACRFTGVGRSFLYSLMEAGRLPYLKLGKRRLIPRAELRRLLAESLKAARDGEPAPPRALLRLRSET
jgi:excisionase family DNA binding protein